MERRQLCSWGLTACITALLYVGMSNTSAQTFDSIPKANDQQILLHSNEIGEDRTIWIHTPAEYNAGMDRYPVLYLLDGGSHFGYVSAMVDRLSGFESNYISKMIVVAIPNTDRGRDFTPLIDDKNQSIQNGSAKFLDFIKNELVPYIEKSFRTQPYRILEAHSLGGLFGVYAYTQAPDLFQAFVIISPALTGGPVQEKVMNNFASSLKKNSSLKNRIFVTIGNEGTQAVDLLTRHLKVHAPKSLQWNFKKYPEENHFSVPYPSMYDGLRFIYSGWHMEIFLNRETLPYSAIKSHFDKLSNEFGYPLTPDEEFLNQCGYQQLAFNHIEQAIEIFKENIKLHPSSFNAYDSMGEAYWVNGQKGLAIENYEKSLVLNPKNENGKEMLKKIRGQ